MDINPRRVSLAVLAVFQSRLGVACCCGILPYATSRPNEGWNRRETAPANASFLSIIVGSYATLGSPPWPFYRIRALPYAPLCSSSGPLAASLKGGPRSLLPYFRVAS
ncbi:hypothetical protein C8Q79DRAFT_278622 [Trametes meyenii]|nr:hypothetical protein C8Q79DRAFT_278622 [Trametes meyenii]